MVMIESIEVYGTISIKTIDYPKIYGKVIRKGIVHFRCYGREIKSGYSLSDIMSFQINKARDELNRKMVEAVYG